MPERVYRHPSKASSKSGSAHMLKIKIEFRESVAPHRPFGRRLFGTMSEDAGGDSDRDLDKKYYWHQYIYIYTHTYESNNFGSKTYYSRNQ